MSQIAFALANFAARPLDYHADQGWGQVEQATSAYFQSLSTFEARLGVYFHDVRRLGFDKVDIWQPILDEAWATDEHIIVARELLINNGIKAVGLAGSLGSTRSAFQRNCEICSALKIPLLVGAVPLAETDRGFVVDMLHEYGLKWAYENYLEKSAAEIILKVGDDEKGFVGICADTGWFGTHELDVENTLRQLMPRLFHVHLKDVREPGRHNSCRYGEGIVPLERCVRILQQCGYEGTIVVEHEPEMFDPSDDIRANLELLKTWLDQP